MVNAGWCEKKNCWIGGTDGPYLWPFRMVGLVLSWALIWLFFPFPRDVLSWISLFSSVPFGMVECPLSLSWTRKGLGQSLFALLLPLFWLDA